MLSFFENIKSIFGLKKPEPAKIINPAPVESVAKEPEDESVCPFSIGLSDDGQLGIFWNDAQPKNVIIKRPPPGI